MVVDDKKVIRERTYPTFAEGYKLLECVGRGSEGSVWRALCVPIKKHVAIKIIDLESLPSSSIEEIHQQIQAMYSCSKHPHVVRYYTSFVHGHSLWCVMRYLSGGSCSDIMRFGHPNGLDEAAIKIVLKDTLKALEYFHANGRIHRDIKAGNIVISESGSVQVADFGVSGSLVEQLRTTLCGSPCWMAPEVMLRAWPQGRAESDGYDYAVDIWSLGITALELAKGRPPFSEFAPSKVFSMVVQNPPPALDDHATKRKFSSSFKDFVSLCLQKDPALRPSASKLLKHKFFKGKKSRDYLASTVLSQLPPLEDRLAVMDIPQTPPAMLPTGQGQRINWNFEDDAVDTLFGASYESTNMLGTSHSNQSLGATSLLSEDSSYSETSFFEEGWFVTPTPSNTLMKGDEAFRTEALDLAAPTPSNTMNREDFENEIFDDLGIAPTPANTWDRVAFEKEVFDDLSLPIALALAPPTPANTMNREAFENEVFDDLSLPLAPPTPANTMNREAFENEVFDDLSLPLALALAHPTPANTMNREAFANEVFADLAYFAAPTPVNTMNKEAFEADISFATIICHPA
jgi:serine/threonine-protein kinase OSR1/STK39